jgi:uncharacterized damage-inducible protein DinB
MPLGDPIEILITFDRWATGRLLDVSETLAPGQFHQPFDIGPGSLHATLTHMIAATRAWTESLSAAEPTPRIDADGKQRTPAELRALFEAAHDDFRAEARRRPFDEAVTRRLRDGRTVTLTRGAAVTQVLTHGMHHRAQCLNMLRRFGVAPLPPSSVAEWAMLGEPRA